MIELILELKRAVRKPDLVIFYDGINDVEVVWEFGRPDVHWDYPRIKNRVEAWDRARRGSFSYFLEANTFQFLQLISPRLGIRPRGVVQRLGSASKIERAARAIADNYLQNVELVGTLAQRYGFKYAFFWQPAMYAEHKPLTPEETRILRSQAQRFAGAETLYPPTYDLMRTAHVPNLHYIADIFNNQANTLYIDTFHISPEGNRLVAARIYEILQQRTAAK